MAAPPPLTWGYTEDNGPSHWGETAPDALGRHQSPIDIIPSEADFDRTLPDRPIVISYSDHHSFNLQNNGHSVQLTVDDDDSSPRSKISRGPMDGDFHLKQFHFHWGSESSRGSEHKIDGKVFAAELHLVHWNSRQFRSFAEAAEATNGLVVLAVFIESGSEQRSLKEVTDLFGEIPFSEDHTTIPEGFNPASLLPDDLTKYWTYSGSLTTPPCHESVRFIVFRQPIQVSEEQLNAFRSLRPRPFTRQSKVSSSTCCRLVNNFRPTMPINDRKVSASFRKFFAA
jgi:carbonic anhydrase